jgi:restriction system protein
MSAHGQSRHLAIDEMPASDAAPRVTLLAATILGIALAALFLLDAAGPYGILLGPVLRPVAWLALAGGLGLALAAVVEWLRVARDHGGSTSELTRRDLRALPPERFADWCADRLREQGYRVTPVAGLSDPGVDLIAERERERLVVQCKRWFGTLPVAEPHVQELYGAMQHEHANGAVVITTGVFSEPTLLKTRGTPIRLWDVDQLMGSAPLPTARVKTRTGTDLAAR